MLFFYIKVLDNREDKLTLLAVESKTFTNMIKDEYETNYSNSPHSIMGEI